MHKIGTFLQFIVVAALFIAFCAGLSIMLDNQAFARQTGPNINRIEITLNHGGVTATNFTRGNWQTFEHVAVVYDKIVTNNFTITEDLGGGFIYTYGATGLKTGTTFAIGFPVPQNFGTGNTIIFAGTDTNDARLIISL